MIDAAKELIDKYKSITLEQLKDLWEEESNNHPDCIIAGGYILALITGFGSCSCILCKAANLNCNICIHKYNSNSDHEYGFCVDDLYVEMDGTENPKELYECIQKRIKHLEKLVSYAEQQTNSSTGIKSRNES